jgi:S-DNA-T family DNA segregation ATPase FtsK/SpoIIIE
MNNENITIKKIYEECLAIGNGEGLIAPLGIKENGEIEYVDYSKINNLIVCGTSGSGKTTFVRTLLTSLMTTSSPEKVKFAIFDSKCVDYTDLNGMPSLLVPVATYSRKCSGMIGWVSMEAEKRQKLFADDPSNINTLPEIFIVLDDYAEIVKDLYTQENLYKLLQVAHRVKIHIIIVTSIALAKVISTELKVNIPHRISFFLPERRNSQVVIDQDGAEALECPGEFIAKFYSKTKTLNAIELSDREVKKFFDFIKSGEKCDEPIFEQILNRWKSESVYFDIDDYKDAMDEMDKQSSMEKISLVFEESDDYEDPIYNEAVQVVLEAGLASTSLLQRRLKLGYSRAERIINAMENNGVVGPYEGSKPRKVLINKNSILGFR